MADLFGTHTTPVIPETRTLSIAASSDPVRIHDEIARLTNLPGKT
jgi:hypothetical protein